MTQKYQVKVSMKQAAIVETGIVLKQGDFGMQIEIEVLDFDATGTTPQIVFRKAMGAVESTTITVSSNKYTYTFKGTELDTPGKVFCDLKLKNSTTQRISTASFMFKVVADTLDGLAEESSSYSDTIAQIIAGYDEDVNKVYGTINGLFELENASNVLHNNWVTLTGSGAETVKDDIIPVERYENLYAAITATEGTDGTQTNQGYVQVRYTDNTYVTTFITNLNTPYKVNGLDNLSKTIQTIRFGGYRSATAPGVPTTSSWFFIAYDGNQIIKNKQDITSINSAISTINSDLTTKQAELDKQKISGEQNLFALMDSEFGFINSSGEVTNSYGNNNTTTDFIPAEVGETYTGHVWMESTASGNLGICFAAYDSNKAFIAGSRSVKGSINRTFNGMKEIWLEYVVPAGSAYIRFAATLCNAGHAQLERGSILSMWKENTKDYKRVSQKIDDYVFYNELGKTDYLKQIDWEWGSLSSGAPTASTSSIRMKNKLPVVSPILYPEYDTSIHNIVVSFYSSSADSSFLKEITIDTEPFIVVPDGTKYIRVRIPYEGTLINPVLFDFRLIPFTGKRPDNEIDFFKNLSWLQGVFSTSTRTVNEQTDKLTSMPFYFGGQGFYEFFYNSIFVDAGHSIWTRVHCFRMDGTRVVYERQAANQTAPWFFQIPKEGVCGFFEIQRAGGGDIAPSDMANAKIIAERREPEQIKRIRLLTHNIGHFNYGGSGSGTENYGIPAPYATNLKAWKDQLAEVKPDIWGIQEYTDILSQEDQTIKINNLVDPIFKSLIPYGTDYGVAGNLWPFYSGELTIGSANRKVQYIKYYLGNNKYLNYINVHLRYDDAEIRASEMQSLITAMQNEEYVIIAGDFNEETTSEADVFVSAGYTKCNGGYFGEFSTYNETESVTQPLDQIVFKGNIRLTNLERKSFVTSDHWALMCDFELY